VTVRPFALREVCQPRIDHTLHLWLPQQKFRHLHRAFLLVHHPRRQLRQAVHQDRPRILGRQHASKILAVQHVTATSPPSAAARFSSSMPRLGSSNRSSMKIGARWVPVWQIQLKPCAPR
jgi:hypothetical protein